VQRPQSERNDFGPAARNWTDYKLQAAKKLVAANPQQTYLGTVPDTLLAIPVLEVELRADGSIANIKVMRYPSQAKDTTQLAIDAVKRAAPFGSLAHLPKPWKYTEVFLFDDDRKFKPRTLDD
jgi:protein TonB